MGRKKKQEQDNGEYVSTSTCDDAPEPEQDEEEDGEGEAKPQQEMFATEPENENPHVRKEDVVVTIQIGAAKITAIKAKEVPTASIPELIIKRLVASRHLRKMICAILDLPIEAEIAAYEYTDACAETVRGINLVKQKQLELQKTVRDAEEKAAKEKERRSHLRRVKPGQQEEKPAPQSDEPPTYDEQVAADAEPITPEDMPTNF